MVAGLLLRISFHSKDSDGVRDTVKFFLVPDLSLSSRLESALVARRWDTALDRSMLIT